MKTPALQEATDPTSEYLKKLTYEITDKFNKRDYGHPVLAHLAPCLRFGQERSKANSRDGMVALHRKGVAQEKQWQRTINSMTIELDESGRQAQVWLVLKVWGPGDLRTECVCIADWEKTREGWFLCRYRGLEGVGGYF